ncbi:MAG: hypothetical protein R3B68_01230 [Phycisphaerales bacterium]
MGTDELAREFIETLYPVAEYAAYVLNKDCAEALALEPLGKFPDTATYAARSMATAPSSYIRCVACLVPLFTPDCDPDLLWELWENETQKRDNPPDSIREELEAARANPEAFGLPPDHANEEPSQPIEEQVSFIAGLEANSVAERIIMSAIAFLDRTDEHKQAAWRVLQDMVQRACDGVDWNDAHFALALLVRSEHPEAPRCYPAAPPSTTMATSPPGPAASPPASDPCSTSRSNSWARSRLVSNSPRNSGRNSTRWSTRPGEWKSRSTDPQSPAPPGTDPTNPQ